MVGERCYLYDMLKNITFDLAIRQYYTDVSLFYIFEESHGEQFGWLRFLPHLQNTQLGGRNIVCDTDSRNSLFEYLYKELSRREAEAATPHSQIVVFVYDDFGLKRHPISRFVERSASLGVNFIFLKSIMTSSQTAAQKLLNYMTMRAVKLFQPKITLSGRNLYIRRYQIRPPQKLSANWRQFTVTR